MPFCKRKEMAALRLLLLVLLFGCTTTITRIKNPVFAGSTDSLGNTLNRFISCEHIKLDGKNVQTNGVDSTVMEIDIINGTGVPEDAQAMNAVADSIATAIKHALKDPGQYGHYAVLFIKEEKSSTVTKRSWKGKVFSAAEL